MRHLSRLRRLGGCAILSLASVASPTLAETTAPSSGQNVQAAAQPNLGSLLSGQAKADYEAARLLYLDGDAASALVKFQSAYDVSHDPRLLWNLAACHKQLRHYSQLEALLKRYVSEGAAVISATDRAEAEALLATVGPFLGDVSIQVNEAGAAVYVDDQLVGQSPLPGALRLDLGARRLRVEKAGYVRYDQQLQVQGGRTIAVPVTLRPEVHQGTLRVFADGGAQIRVDAELKGVGVWSGVLPSGQHLVEVSATGKLPYRSDIVISDDQTNTLRAMLENRTPPTSGFDTTWLWVAGSAILAAGLGVAAYHQFGPEQHAAAPITGTLNQGTVTASSYKR
jgi:hypothetical protein